jgi:hypothetical protein
MEYNGVMKLMYECMHNGPYASMQGGAAGAGSVLCWHPHLPILAVATNAALVEYDAVSGCRRNMVDCDGSPVKLQYTLDGEYLVLLTRVRCVHRWGLCVCNGLYDDALRQIFCRKEIFMHGQQGRGRKRLS